MNRLLFHSCFAHFLVFFATGLLYAQTSTQAPTEQRRGRISGQVSSRDTGNTLKGADIEIPGLKLRTVSEEGGAV